MFKNYSWLQCNHNLEIQNMFKLDFNYLKKCFLHLILLFWGSSHCLELEGFCREERNCNAPNYRYIFYDVNPPEGFNLRRDVYMRYAIFLNNLKNSLDDLNNFKLVLPPWSYLYHWNYDGQKPEQTPWSYFFDLESLQKFAPVIEMYQFFDEISPRYTRIQIDEVYILQHFKDMFESGNFEEKMKVEVCNEPIDVNFFYYDNVTSNGVKCLSFHGHTSQLSEILKKSESRTFLFHHAEVALHDRFGDAKYWQCRRSMRFNKELKQIATEYRAKFLNSTDETDNTVLPEDWTKEKARRTAKGGPYLSVHLRRRDFLRGRPNDVPGIENAAKQIIDKLSRLELNTVFIASDATDKEIKDLTSLLSPTYRVLKYEPTESMKTKYKDGELAIIDQIVCSYARYFIGTHESTFSFRIQEEREILGFPVETTFNRLCGDKKKCDRPSVWKIVY